MRGSGRVERVKKKKIGEHREKNKDRKSAQTEREAF